MTTRVCCVLIALLMLTATASAYDREIVLNQVTPINWQGTLAYEYIYDIYGTPQCNFRLNGFNVDRVLNLYNGAFYDKWGAWSAGYWGFGAYFGYLSGPHPSYGEGDEADTWWINPDPAEISENYWVYDAAYSAVHGVVNTWHAPSEYAAAEGDFWFAGSPQDTDADTVNDQLFFGYGECDHYNTTELEMTLRIIHLDGPNGTLTYEPDGLASSTVVGPGPGSGSLGDFDSDGDVDTDDIDILCNNMGDAAYDLDGDGDADADDYIKLIQELVELTDGSGRTGTEVGDFNLDGLINATDLATMAATFGATPPPELLYGDGNANCDELINATDLAILAANFGYVAPAGAVPEPMTVSLLAMGAAAILRRKS